jgi:ABC-type branched-subunit amino acid transport system ATPase component
MPALLELKGVSMAFGGLKCVDGLDLHVDEGEILSVIGPNGAGKTTLFNLVTGVYEPTGGDILFAGESITGLSPHRITQRGIARTFQTLRLFLNMSVRENVMAAAYGHTKAGVFRSILRTPGMRREEREIRELAEKRLAFFGERLMGYRWDQPAYSLPCDPPEARDRRATATNRGCCSSTSRRPGRTKGRRDHGAHIEPVTRWLHDPGDERYARRRGHPTAWSRSTTASRSQKGRSKRSRRARASWRRPRHGAMGARPTVPSPAEAGDRPTTVDPHPHRLEPRRRRGELVCLLGGNASGKSTTLKTILGVVAARTGKVVLGGEDVTRLPTAHRIVRGLAIVPENRRLFGPMTVLENLELGAYLRTRRPPAGSPPR